MTDKQDYIENLDTTELKLRLKEQRRITAQPWWLRVQVYLATIGLAIMLTAIVGWLMPFEPFEVYSFYNVPEEVCPGEPLNVSYTSRMKAGPYTLGKMTGVATILKDGKVVEDYPIDTDVYPYEKKKLPSLVERTAPLEPGEYEVGFDVVVGGREFGLVPKYQDVEYISDKTFRVLPISDPSCLPQ